MAEDAGIFVTALEISYAALRGVATRAVSVDEALEHYLEASYDAMQGLAEVVIDRAEVREQLLPVATLVSVALFGLCKWGGKSRRARKVGIAFAIAIALFFARDKRCDGAFHDEPEPIPVLKSSHQPSYYVETLPETSPFVTMGTALVMLTSVP